MKIKCMTVAIGREYTSRVRRCLQSRRDYCSWHGLDLTFLSDTTILGPRPASWMKVISAIQMVRNMNEGDVLYVADADVMVCNYNISLVDLWHERYAQQDRPLVYCSEPAGLNHGVFFVRAGQDAKDVLEKIWDQEEYISHPHWEQAAARSLYQGDEWFRSQVYVEPVHRILHSYPPVPERKVPMHYESGDFQIHFAGFHGPNFTKMIQQYQHLEGGHEKT